MTQALAGDCIVKVYPRFRDQRVEFLGEGWDFRVFAVGDIWIFRFPKHDAGALSLGVERELLPRLAEWLTLPIPDHELYARSFREPRWPFAGYRRLAGVPGDTVRAVDRAVTAGQLGAFLSELHEYPVDRVLAAGVPEDPDPVARMRRRTVAQLERSLPLGRGGYLQPEQILDALDAANPNSLVGEHCLVHNDLWAEHVLIDSESGSVAGIIDWGDAVVGDPAVDFAGLYAWFGEAWVSEILTHYRRPVDAGFLSRVRFLAICMAVHNITLGNSRKYSPWVVAGQRALRLALDRQGG